MSKTVMFQEIAAKFMESVAMDDDANLVVIDEEANAAAGSSLDALFTEIATEKWMALESAEDSLADMADQISFSELNADPSSVVSPEIGDVSTDEPTIEGMLESDSFDLRSIFALNEDGDEMVDGDDEYDELVTGNDENGIGSDIEGSEFDNDDDALDDMGDMGDIDDGDVIGDDTEFDFSFLDDNGDDEESDDLVPSFGDDEESDDELEPYGDDEFAECADEDDEDEEEEDE